MPTKGRDSRLSSWSRPSQGSDPIPCSYPAFRITGMRTTIVWCVSSRPRAFTHVRIGSRSASVPILTNHRPRCRRPSTGSSRWDNARLYFSEIVGARCWAAFHSCARMRGESTHVFDSCHSTSGRPGRTGRSRWRCQRASEASIGFCTRSFPHRDASVAGSPAARTVGSVVWLSETSQSPSRHVSFATYKPRSARRSPLRRE